MTASTDATTTELTGKTSRGQYTRFSSWVFDSRLSLATETDVEKNVHTNSPMYEKTG